MIDKPDYFPNERDPEKEAYYQELMEDCERDDHILIQGDTCSISLIPKETDLLPFD